VRDGAGTTATASWASPEAKVASVAWDFPDSNNRDAIHVIHPYPARFIPEIPRELIRLFHPGDDSPVLDPFCGSGTTLVEAGRTGLPSVGIDLHPLAILIARVKTTPLPYDLREAAQRVAIAARETPTPVPSIPRINHWFQPEVQDALARLVTQIDGVRDRAMRDALRVVLSRIVVRVSNQESNTRYAAIQKDVSFDLVFQLFDSSADFINAALRDRFEGLLSRSAPCSLLARNILDVTPTSLPAPVGLTVTSPPYPNAYEYWLYHKYRMYWLGMDPLAVREAEIGARLHYFKKNHHTALDFERQMGEVFALLAAVQPSGTYACFLVGRSVIHGREIDNAALLQRAAAPHDFRSVADVDRHIAPTRKAFNPANSRIDRETILVFERQ